MTIEHAPNTNGHRGAEPAPPAERPAPHGASASKPDTNPARTPRRRVSIDPKGLLLSSLVAAAVVLVLRRIDRGQAR